MTKAEIIIKLAEIVRQDDFLAMKKAVTKLSLDLLKELIAETHKELER